MSLGKFRAINKELADLKSSDMNDDHSIPFRNEYRENIAFGNNKDDNYKDNTIKKSDANVEINREKEIRQVRDRPVDSNPIWWAGLPLNYCSPEFHQQIIHTMIETGRWTEIESTVFLQNSLPAYAINDYFARDINTGELPSNALDRAVNMVERLNLIPPDMSKVQFRQNLQHGVSVWYPMNMIADFVDLYCDTDKYGRIKGWNQAVLAFLHHSSIPVVQWKDRLPRLDSEPSNRQFFTVEPGLDYESRQRRLRQYYQNFGINPTFSPTSAGGLSIETRLEHCGRFVMGGVPGAGIERTSKLRKYLRVRAAEIRQLSLNVPIFNMKSLRDIMLLANQYSLAEEGGGLTYHYKRGEPTTLESLLISHIRGGLGEYMHLSWLLNRRLLNAFWQSIGFTPRGITNIEVGRSYTGIFISQIHSANPDFVIRDQSIKSQVLKGEIVFKVVDNAIWIDEISTESAGTRLDGDFRTFFLGLIAVTRNCNPLAGIRRSGIYRGTTLRYLDGTAISNSMINLLAGNSITGLNPDIEWIKINPLSGREGGIEGTARIDDGDGTHSPCHIWFRTTPSLANSNMFDVKIKIGQFDSSILPYLPGSEREAPNVASVQFMPGSIWYDSTQCPTSILIESLRDNESRPISTSWITKESVQFGQHLMLQFLNSGSIDREDWIYIREHDPGVFHAVMEYYYSWITSGYSGTFITRNGVRTSKFQAETLIRTLGNSQMYLLPSHFDLKEWEGTFGVWAWTTYNLARIPISCPAVGGAAGRVETDVLTTITDAWNLQDRIDQDFILAEIPAQYFSNIIVSNLPWQEMADLIRKGNRDTIDQDTTNWHPSRNQGDIENHLCLIEHYLSERLVEMRYALHNSADIEMSHTAIREFLYYLRNEFPDGTPFPHSRVNVGGSADSVQTKARALVDQWFAMWGTILDGHGVQHSLYRSKDRGSERNLHALVAHFQRAIIHDWPIGEGNARTTDILFRHYLQLSTSERLVLDAQYSGFHLRFAHSPMLDGWRYAVVRYQPLPSQPTIEYIVRCKYNSDSRNSNDDGFQVCAVPTNPSVSLVMSCHYESPVRAKDLLGIIEGLAAIPSGYSSLESYLDSLAYVQVGGKRKILSRLPDPSYVEELINLI